MNDKTEKSISNIVFEETRDNSNIFFPVTRLGRWTASCLVLLIHFSESERSLGMQAPRCPFVGIVLYPPLLSSPVRRRALFLHVKARPPLHENMPSCREVHLVVVVCVPMLVLTTCPPWTTTVDLFQVSTPRYFRGLSRVCSLRAIHTQAPSSSGGSIY